MIEIIVREVKPLKMNKTEEAAAGVDGTIEMTTGKEKADNMTSLPVTLKPSHEQQLLPSPWDFHMETFE